MKSILRLNINNVKPIIGYIYVTLLNGIPKYVGQSCILNYNHSINYKGSGKIIQRYIKKYGSENLFSVIIDYASTHEELNDLEELYIHLYNTLVSRYGGNGWNISSGGNGHGTYKRGQQNGASKTNMPLEKRIEKARKAKETYFKHKLAGKIITRTLSKQHRMILSQKAKERWSYLKKIGKADELKSRSGFNTLSSDQRRANALKGSYKAKSIALKLGNPNAKLYTAIEPDGTTHIIKGEFSKFCKKFKLSLVTAKRFLNKGKIPVPRNQNRTEGTLNLVGWEFIGGEFMRKNCKRRLK